LEKAASMVQRARQEETSPMQESPRQKSHGGPAWYVKPNRDSLIVKQELRSSQKFPPDLLSTQRAIPERKKIQWQIKEP
jgi:hypothetical protein